MSKKIVISGWYGFGNIGDEVILQAMIDTFEKKYPNCNITVLSYKPEYTKKVQQVDAVFQIPIQGIKKWIKNIILLRWIPTLKAIKGCDIFVMGGGGFLSDWQPEVPRGWLKQMRIAKFFGKKTMLYGIGAGPFLTDKGKKDTKYYIDNFVDEITVRDNESYEQLVNSVKVSVKVSVTYDPVSKLNIKRYNIKKTDNNLMGIIFTPHFNTEHWKNNNKWLELLECYKAMISSVAKNKKIKLIFFQKDIEKELAVELANNNMDITLSFPESYYDAIKEMSSCKAIISFRLHGNILAYVLNKPFLPIIYHHKTDGFLNKINFKKRDITIEVGEGLNWRNLPFNKDEWYKKAARFIKYVDNSENFYSKVKGK